MDGRAINFIEDVGWQGGGGEGIRDRWQIASEVGDESFGTCKRTSANGSCVLLALLQESGGLRFGVTVQTLENAQVFVCLGWREERDVLKVVCLTAIDGDADRKLVGGWDIR